MTSITITVPNWLDRICARPVVVYRRARYGSAFRKIGLTQGQFAIVSANDYYILSKFKWTLVRCHKKRYAVHSVRDEQRGKNVNIYMHRFIMNPPEGMKVDHKNGDGLDDRRENLRIATGIQNCWNRRKQTKTASSRFKGVSWSQKDKKWRARIRFNNQTKFLGLFTEEIEAARVYDRAAIKYHGEFARLNFPVDVRKV